MMTAFTVLVALIGLLHVYIFLLETVLFQTRGRKVFGLSKEKADLVAPLMSNQGCYNGFLAAALALGVFHPDPAIAKAFAYFGLACVAVAGVWGAATAKKSILFIQTVPAVIALAIGFLA
jgi:putative membrane protein